MKASLNHLAAITKSTRANGMRWALARVRGRIAALIARPTPALLPEPQGLRLADDTLFAFYDLDLHPISYDVAMFVLRAEIERERRGLTRLHAVFVPMTDPLTRPVPENYAAVIDLQSRLFRFENICVPFATMLPSSAGYTVCGSREHGALLRRIAPQRFPADGERPAHVDYSRAVLDHAASTGGEFGFRASVQAKRYVREWLDQNVGQRKPVIITLRQYKVDPTRNSDPEAWTRFAKSLDPSRFCPVFVPDTDHVFDPSETWYRAFPVFEAACWNVGMRLAIYEAAYLNLFVNTGPAILCYMGTGCRYIFFKVHVPHAELASIEFIEAQGYRRNQSPRHATPFQKWVWEPDTFEVIGREFRAMEHRIGTA